MSEPITGVSIKISVNTGTEASPVWTEVGGQRNATLNRSKAEINASDKTTQGWERTIGGLKKWSIDADGLYIYDDAGYAALENAFLTDQRVQVAMAMPDGKKRYGLAEITDFPIEAPYDDAATYSITLSGAGALNKEA